MKERLRKDLRRVAVPGEEEARERAWEVVVAAYREQAAEPAGKRWARRRARPLLASALGVLAALALALTPAGADVRQWLGDVIDSGETTRELALTRLPAPGTLLVSSEAGLWTVERDGSRRLLGDYEAGSWSPHGMYVAAANGRRLSAIDPRGEVRWAITRGPVSDPRWSPGDGYRIAYRSGSELRVVWGDGTNDEGFGSSADVAPAWRPGTGEANVLAYVDGERRIRILDVDGKESEPLAAPLSRPVAIDWSRDGREILAVSDNALRIIEADGAVRWARRVPASERAIAAGFGPERGEVTAVLRSRDGEARSSVVEMSVSGDRPVQRVFTGSGSLEGLTFSPDGSRYLVGWPDADQWLFFPTGRTNRIVTVGNIANQFGSPGERAAFPRVEGWCCGI